MMVYYIFYPNEEGHQIKVGTKPSVIAINGNRYDAITGQLVKAADKSSSHFNHSSLNPTIDGVRRQPQASPALKRVAATLSAVKPKRQIVKKRPNHPAHKVHLRTQRSKTLMRSVVAKPGGRKSDEPKIKTAKARSFINPARFSKAMNIAKNSSVRRFGVSASHAKPTIAPAAASHSRRVLSGEVMSSRPAVAGSAAAVIQAPPSMITSVSHQRLERMLDEALLRADGHKQALAGRLSNRRALWRRIRTTPTWMVVSIVAFVIVFTAGLFAWRNIPAVSMKFASMRTHVSASVPGYKPAGFSIAGPATATANSVTLQYKANNDSSKFYTVKEEISNQNSSSLIANNASPDQQVQTSQANGVPIIITNGKTMCVSGGKLTTVANKAGLSPDELLSIAKSVCS